MARLDGVHAAAEPHDVGHELGHALGIDPAYGQPVALVVELPEARKARLCCAIEVGHAYPHGVTAEELVERALRDHAAAVDDGDAVTDLLHLAEEVRVEENGRAALAQPADDLAHVVPADRIERARRLVEHDEVGRAEQRDAEAKALLHSLRERTDAARSAVGESDDRERVLDLALPRGAVDPRKLAVEREDLARAQPRLITEQLGQVADATERVAIADRRAEDLSVTRRRRRQPEQQLHRRRLAGAVRSEESEDVAARNGHRQPGERDDAAVSLGQLLRAYGGRVDQCRGFATASTCCSVSVPA